MQKIKACTAQLHYTSLNTWKLLHLRMASLLQVYRYRLLCQRCCTWSSIPRLHATSLGTRTGFFLDKAPSVQDSGQDKEFRDCSETVPGHLATMQCDACSVTNKMYSVTLHYNASHCMQHTSSQYITLYATHHTVCNMCCLARSWGIMLQHLIVG